MLEAVQAQRDYLQVYSKSEVQQGAGVAAGRRIYSTVPVGSVAYGSLGTSTATVAGTIYIAEVFIPRRMTVNGAAVLNGATASTDDIVIGLWDHQGNLVASTALTGALSANANVFQAQAFTADYIATPGRYFIGVQGEGTTATIRLIAASTFVDCMTGSQTGTFGTLPALTTVPVTFTATVGPIAYVYGVAAAPATT
jgi:hypothetical protein